MTHPSVSSSILTVNAAALQSRKQMEPCPSSNQKTREAAQALQRLCQLLSVLFPGHRKGGREQAVTLLRKPFLKESGSEEECSWPSVCLRPEIRGEWKEDRKDSYVIPCPVPAFSDLVSYTRGFGAALSAANSTRGGCSQHQAHDDAHQTVQFLSWMSNRPYLTTVTRYPSALSMSST